jgi:hypothetical protein
MKKIYKLTFAISFWAIILLLTFSSCKKDSSNKSGLNGRWKASFTATNQTAEFEFKSDNTYEYSLSGIDSATSKTGIIAKQTGRYQLKDNKQSLNLYEIVNYSNKNYKPGPVSDLVTAAGNKTSDYSISFDDKENKFSLVYHCGPAEFCMPTNLQRYYYYRQ